MFESAAPATAAARCPRHHALRCRTSLATHLATVVAVSVAAISDTALVWRERQRARKTKFSVVLICKHELRTLS